MIKRSIYQALVACLIAVFSLSSMLPGQAEAAVSTWQQGASLYPKTKTDIASPAGLAAIDQLAASGANYLTIIIPYYQSNLTSHDLKPGKDTPTDSSLRAATARARAKGMNVMYKIHMEPMTGEWRAHIKPRDRGAWFHAYTAAIKHYARLAQANGVAQFTVGSELVSLTSPRFNTDNTARWQEIIRQVRSVFKGTLTYSAQRPGPMGELETIRFWPQLDYIGMSGYFPLRVDGEPAKAKLLAAWSYWESRQIRPIQARYKKPMLFTEIGYRSISGSYADPWNYQRTGSVNEAHQAMAYDAFFSFWNNVGYMHGVHLWDWEPHNLAGGPHNNNYTAQNKAAYQVLVRWWGGSATAPPPPPVPTGAIDVWWPTPHVAISGIQTFKAMLPNRALDQYTIYWKTSGTQQYQLHDSYVDYPHKELAVNLSQWPNGTYNIEFVAYDPSGRQIASRTVPVRVVR